MNAHAALPPSVDVPDRWQARVDELEADRRRLRSMIELFRELSKSVSYRDVVQVVARRMGHALGLDRCSVFLTERSNGTVHLVASYEDPGLRGHVIDLHRYPELRQALDTGNVVHIPDTALEPSLRLVQDVLLLRRVRSIAVVPLARQASPIGAIFLRTDRSRPALNPAELEWASQVAEVTANTLHVANRLEHLESRLRGGEGPLALDRERAALLAFAGRLLTAFAEREATVSDELLPRAGSAEIERLVGVALRVLEREATR